MADFTKRDIEDTIWSVLTSFAFDETEEKSDKSHSFVLDKSSAFISGDTTEKARAEAVCACIEVAFACDLQDFKAKVSNEAVFNLLVLFGFENILQFDGDTKNCFSLYSDNTVFASGTFEDKKTTAIIDINALFEICEKGENSQNVSKSLVYAESGAEGIAYDICYNLRVNGCIIEMYTDNGDIKTANEYAKKEGHSAIVRCFADGKVEIKDFLKNEIIMTTVSEFLGYYKEDDESCCEEHEHHGCDCGHSHEHEHHDCDCGHHHN